MESHLVGRFETHEQAQRAVAALSAEFPGKVSLSSNTPHESWKKQGKWLETSLQAIGGIAATVSGVVPGFGVLFMGGPLDGVVQGKILAEWLEHYPEHGEDMDTHFVIVSVERALLAKAEKLLAQVGAHDVHVTKA